MWKCHQDVADVVVVVEEEEEVAEDLPPHVIPGVICTWGADKSLA